MSRYEGSMGFLWFCRVVYKMGVLCEVAVT